MRSRILAGALSLVVVFAAGTAATGGHRVGPVRQWAIVNLSQPTLVGTTIVQGPVLFTHDDAKMARGEPCTTVRLMDPATGPTEEIAAFHCIATERRVVGTFTIRTRPNDELGFGCILTEYQFAGDAEGHVVPITAHAH
jgi:hypothetical protein